MEGIMPINKSDSSETRLNKKPAPRAVVTKLYVRLARHGARGEMGLGRYYSAELGRLYRRDKIYHVTEKVAKSLIDTGYFEVIHEANLARAQREAGQGRGASLSARQRAKRRQAARRNQAVNPEEVDFNQPEDLLDSASDMTYEEAGDEEGLEV